MRCYEFYCMVLKNPEFCEGKGDRIVDYINEYMTFMNTRGVKFDRSQTDKARFSALQGKYGSEYQTTQLSEKDLALIPEEKPEIGKTEPQELADAFSPISTVKAETSQIQSSLPEKSVESCPDGVCATSPEEFLAKPKIMYHFEDCLCKSCPHHNDCFEEEKK